MKTSSMLSYLAFLISAATLFPAQHFDGPGETANWPRKLDFFCPRAEPPQS
jgi:hypothetical protein